MGDLLPVHCRSVGLRGWDASPGCQGSIVLALEKPSHILESSQMAELLHGNDKTESKKGWKSKYFPFQFIHQ